MPSKAIAGGLAVAGLAIMIGCAVPMSKETDKTSSKYKGLTAGVVIGVLMIVAGIVMFFMGGGGGAGLPGNANMPSAEAGSQAAAMAADPLTIATNAAKATELTSVINAEKAKNILNASLKAQNHIGRAKAFFETMSGAKK
jgi:hypothetical protein